LLDQRYDLIIDVFVAYRVSKSIETGAQKILCVHKSNDVSGDAKVVLMRFVDNGAVEFRAQFLVLAVAVIDPDLDEVGFLYCQLLYGLPGFRFSCHPVRHVRSSRLRARDATARGAEQSSIWDDLLPHLIRLITGILPETDDCSDCVIRLSLQRVDEFFPLLRLMRVRIHDCGHDRFVGQINSCCTGGNIHLAFPADLQETAVLNDERGIFNWSAAISDDQPRPFKYRDCGRLALDVEGKHSNKEKKH